MVVLAKPGMSCMNKPSESGASANDALVVKGKSAWPNSTANLRNGCTFQYAPPRSCTGLLFSGASYFGRDNNVSKTLVLRSVVLSLAGKRSVVEDSAGVPGESTCESAAERWKVGSVQRPSCRCRDGYARELLNAFRTRELCPWLALSCSMSNEWVPALLRGRHCTRQRSASCAEALSKLLILI